MARKTTFLFWNINKKPREEQIKNLAQEHQVDVLLLAESIISPAMLLERLNSERVEFFFSSGFCEKIQVFTRFSAEFSRPVQESNRLTIRTLTLPATEDTLLACLHFPSKVNWTNIDQMLEITSFVNMIKDVEEREGHQQTILVGDFNMNPFEEGMIAAGGFHGVMDQRIAQRVSRTVQEKEYSFFYNPMWSYLGDLSRGIVAGTHYHDKSGSHVNYHWNIFDQVLIRPTLLKRFDSNDLDIITTDGFTSFLDTKGRVDSEVSDHLPLKFSLYL